MAIPVLFYIIVLSAGIDLSSLRTSGWLFDMGSSSESRWYEFYMHYSTLRKVPCQKAGPDLPLDFGNVQFGPLLATIPTQLALWVIALLQLSEPC